MSPVGLSGTEQQLHCRWSLDGRSYKLQQPAHATLGLAGHTKLLISAHKGACSGQPQLRPSSVSLNSRM